MQGGKRGTGITLIPSASQAAGAPPFHQTLPVEPGLGIGATGKLSFQERLNPE